MWHRATSPGEVRIVRQIKIACDREQQAVALQNRGLRRDIVRVFSEGRGVDAVFRRGATADFYIPVRFEKPRLG